MLLQKYYPTFLAFSVFSGPLCGASRNIRWKVKEQITPESTSSHKQYVLELERRQGLATTPATFSQVLTTTQPSSMVVVSSSIPSVFVTVVTSSTSTGVDDVFTDITTVVDILTVSPSPLAPVTVTSVSTAPPLQPTIPTSSSSLSSSSTTTSQTPVITATPLCDPEYYLCEDEYNGGCCRSGFSCAIGGCVPPATVTEPLRTCGPQSYLCPQSLNYGCCPNAFGCGATVCVSTPTATDYISTTITPYAYAKATDIDLTAKQPTRASTSPSTSSTQTSSPLGSGVPLSGIAIGGIIAGSVIGVLVFVLAGWCTCRRLRHRGNNDPPGGVTTTNFFDPSAPVSGSSGAHFTQDQSYFPKQPAVPVVNHAPVMSYIPVQSGGVVEIAGSPVMYSHGTNWWGSGHPAPGGIQLPSGDVVYEIGGALPAGKRAKRWSKPFKK